MDGTDRVALRGSEPSPHPGGRSADAPPPDAPMLVTLYLRDRAGEEADEPGRALSREEYAARHGASDEDIRAVEAFAARFGLTARDVDRAARRVYLAGSAAQIGAAFGVELAGYQGEGGPYLSHDGPVRLPADVADAVETVLGLDNVPIAHPER